MNLRRGWGAAANLHQEPLMAAIMHLSAALRQRLQQGRRLQLQKCSNQDGLLEKLETKKLNKIATRVSGP
jgi:hypothetical protein